MYSAAPIFPSFLPSQNLFRKSDTDDCHCGYFVVFVVVAVLLMLMLIWFVVAVFVSVSVAVAVAVSSSIYFICCYFMPIGGRRRRLRGREGLL